MPLDFSPLALSTLGRLLGSKRQDDLSEGLETCPSQRSLASRAFPANPSVMKPEFLSLGSSRESSEGGLVMSLPERLAEGLQLVLRRI